MTLTNKIFLALFLGVVAGSIINSFAPDLSVYLIDIVSVLGKIFISSLKMLIVPVVFFSIVCGVANLGDVAALGRIGGKAIFLYLFSTSIAITLALIFANIIDPGSNSSLSLNLDYQTQSAPAIGNILESLIPSNPLKALTDGNMLQIICFAIILGITLTRLEGNNLNKIKGALNAFNELFLKMIDVIMYFAPYGVFFLIFKTFMTQGFSAILELSQMVMLICCLLRVELTELV